MHRDGCRQEKCPRGRARPSSVQPDAIPNPGAEIKRQSRICDPALAKSFVPPAVTESSRACPMVAGLVSVPKSSGQFDGYDMRILEYGRQTRLGGVGRMYRCWGCKVVSSCLHSAAENYCRVWLWASGKFHSFVITCSKGALLSVCIEWTCNS